MTRCDAHHGETLSIQCSRRKGHHGLHRWQRGPFWASPLRDGRCPYVDPIGRVCCLPRDHWVAHRTYGGWQFAQRNAHLEGSHGSPLALLRFAVNALRLRVFHGSWPF